ncbi:MAG: VOC family protein [Chloroflexi bacterium]|nr:VOC family protein [Chloroflexota bacterium]
MTADSGKLTLGTIGQIAISVSDIDSATEFYRDMLGLRFLFGAPPSMSFFDCDGVRLMLTVPEHGEKPRGDSNVVFPFSEVQAEEIHPRRIAHGFALYFTVPDVPRATQVLKSRGVRFIGEPRVIHSTDTYDLWMSFFTDLDGNTLALMAEDPK